MNVCESNEPENLRRALQMQEPLPPRCAVLNEDE